jgi:corrinoid protein of di/trimethylamine methyltransferase
MNDFLKRCAAAVLDGDKAAAADLAREAREARDDGVDLLRAIEEGFAAGVREAGGRFEAGEYFLPELAFSAEAMKAAMGVLEPALRERGEHHSRGTVLIGTVRGDIHDIGKSLVATMLLANNFHVVDLGCDVAGERFVDETRRLSPDLVCLSALLTTTMSAQADVVAMLEESGLRDRVKVLVGGAPTSAEWARQIGADAHAPNAVAAVETAGALVEKRSR